MSALLPATVIAAYASLALELTALHVPSIASTRKIWSRPPLVEAAYSRPYRRVFSLSRPAKAALFVLPLIIVFGVYIYPLISILGPRETLGSHLFDPSNATDALAVVLIVVGRVVALRSVVAMRRAGGGATEPETLCTGGPFRFSRNPVLVGMYVFVVGLWVAAPSLPMLGGILVYVVYMDFKVRMEEDYLQNRFGASYLAYRTRTSRYWP